MLGVAVLPIWYSDPYISVAAVTASLLLPYALGCCISFLGLGNARLWVKILVNLIATMVVIASFAFSVCQKFYPAVCDHSAGKWMVTATDSLLIVRPLSVGSFTQFVHNTVAH